MAERSIAPSWKGGDPAGGPWVRIPLLPPLKLEIVLEKHTKKANKRASRRMHAETLKKRYSKYSSKVTDRNDAKQIGKVFQCPQACSCSMCCNDRRNPYAKKERLTLQERTYDDVLTDGVEEYYDE